MGEESKKYHITDDGDVFKVNDDGSFTKMGNVQEKSISIDYNSVGSQSKTKSKPAKAIVIFLIILALLVIGFSLYYIVSNTYENKAVVADTVALTGGIAVPAIEYYENQTEEKIKSDNIVFHWNDFLRYDSKYGYSVKDYNELKQFLEKNNFKLTNTDSWTKTCGIEEEEDCEIVEVYKWTYSYTNSDNITIYEIDLYNSYVNLSIRVNDNALYNDLKRSFESVDFTRLPDGSHDGIRQVSYGSNIISIAWDVY